MTQTSAPASAPSATDEYAAGLNRTVDWRRLRRPATAVSLSFVFIAAVAETLGTVVIGHIAENPAASLVLLLALCVVGGAIVYTTGRIIWSTIIDRAEGTLRQDLLTAALHQPLATLSEQAVGEILDRVDDDTHEVGNLMRWQVWGLCRMLFGVGPMWIVAGITWWPSFFLFPAVAVLTWFVVRKFLTPISERKVIEEIAWTDHAAAVEEGVAGRDDLRTSLGQSFVVRRVAELSALVHERFAGVVSLEARVTRRAGLLLHSLLAGIVVAGVALAYSGNMSTAKLVTLFLVTSSFVGFVGQMAEQLPDLQAGLGALVRLRQMFALEPEPVGGSDIPAGDLDIEMRDLHFAYTEGTFALQDIELTVPAGHTLALVGRTGSGKTTLASLISRAVDPPRGTLFLGGVDVLDLDLNQLRSAVGVVSQRTDILAGTLAQNIALFEDYPMARIEAAIDELGLRDWVEGLPNGLQTALGAGGEKLSAGEEQLIAFARLLVRDVKVVVLDEATARMDPLTERRVVRASDRLLARRTGILIAHRLSTTARADDVAVLKDGRIIQLGPRETVEREDGPFKQLLHASGLESGSSRGLEESDHFGSSNPAGGSAAAGHAVPGGPEAAGTASGEAAQVGQRRRQGEKPDRPEVSKGSSLAKGIFNALRVRPEWGIGGWVGFLVVGVLGAQGAVTGFAWGHVVAALESGEISWGMLALVLFSLLAAPLVIADAIRRYPRWWVEVLLRTRMAVLFGQTKQHRLPGTPPGEIVARAMDADRYARYADRWIDFTNGLVISVFTAFLGGTPLAGAVLIVVLVASALASSLGRPVAGRTAAKSSHERAQFGRFLVSALESARTVKLAGATPAVHHHLRQVDSGRVDAAVREHRIQAFLEGVPVVMVRVGIVVSWAAVLWGWWGLATALLVSQAVSGFDWFGRVAGAVVTDAPGTRAWQVPTAQFAGGVDLMQLPPGVDLVSGEAPKPERPSRQRLEKVELVDFTAIHDDGTIGVSGVNLEVSRGELVLVIGQVGSGKSSMLSALAGLTPYYGQVRWNGNDVEEREVFLRPGQVAHVAQVPRVLSGTFRDNIQLDHERDLEGPIRYARLDEDVAAAGGVDAVVGHRGVRLSGGQVQRLALARALATDAELLLADDVSSALDAATELELWSALRERGSTVIGATSKQAALALADTVVVLDSGQVQDVGPWNQLRPRWSHLAG